MDATLEELKSTVSSLPVSERTELVHYLLRTLEAAEEWLALAEQRMVEVKAGRVIGIPVEQVMECLQRQRP